MPKRSSTQRQRALASVDRWYAIFSRDHASQCLARDPLQFARRYSNRQDRELVAMFSALLAFGNIGVIVRKLDVLFGLLGTSPSHTVQTTPRDVLIAQLSSFRHRTFGGEDIARLLNAAGTIQSTHHGLYAVIERTFAQCGDLRTALAEWVSQLRSHAWPEGLTRSARHLLPDPLGPSAAKRLFLLMRWVIRPDDGIDLGLVSIAPAALTIPVDVHVHRIARNLGFTKRADASRQTAEEITTVLRQLSPEDPVRYDMAICHLGISLHCPSRRDATRCEGCALRDVCVHWQGKQ
jgi:uncharacterized protein (TIGR02757 family)